AKTRRLPRTTTVLPNCASRPARGIVIEAPTFDPSRRCSVTWSRNAVGTLETTATLTGGMNTGVAQPAGETATAAPDIATVTPPIDGLGADPYVMAVGVSESHAAAPRPAARRRPRTATARRTGC